MYATVPQSPYAPGTGRVDIASYGRVPAALDNGAGFSQGRAQMPTDTAGYAGRDCSDLSRTFYSAANVDALQDAIRYRVYQATDGLVIGRQSEQELYIVMRSIYLQYGQNQPTDILGQVRDLNQKVLDYAVPEVLSNVRQFQKYKTDISTLPVPLPHAPLATMKGTRTLEITRFF